MNKPVYSRKSNKNYDKVTTIPKKYLRIDDLLTIEPMTDKQDQTIKAYKNGKNLLLHGLAGTGKTFLATALALEEVLDPSSEYKQVCFFRSVVPTRNMGFLKGSEEEKIAVYEAPYKAICEELFNVSNAYDILKSQNTIRFDSTSFVRGLTLNNSIIIIDEFENLNFHELDSVITRVGSNSKVILCGDYTQSDFTTTNEKKGCLDFMRIIKELPIFKFVEFGVDDIVRGTLVKSYIVAKYKLNLHV